jgi:hypothetical protein
MCWIIIYLYSFHVVVLWILYIYTVEQYWTVLRSQPFRARNAIQMSVVCSDTNLAIDKSDLERSCRTGPKKCLILAESNPRGLELSWIELLTNPTLVDRAVIFAVSSTLTRGEALKGSFGVCTHSAHRFVPWSNLPPQPDAMTLGLPLLLGTARWLPSSLASVLSASAGCESNPRGSKSSRIQRNPHESSPHGLKPFKFPIGIWWFLRGFLIVPYRNLMVYHWFSNLFP